MTKIAVNACTGRMGQEIMLAVDKSRDVHLGGAVLRQGHSWVGSLVNQQFPELTSKIPLVDDLSSIKSDVDVLIDFSMPEHSVMTAKQSAELSIPIVIGTTGFSYKQKQEIESLGEKIPVLMAPNTSVGVTLSLKILELVTKAIGNESDIEIIESHHRYKKDSPSGTALRMGEVIAQALGKGLSEIAAFDRCGKDAVRKPGSIGFSAIRAGNIVGEHTALFAMAGEEIEITHKAQSRQTFAIGAVKAACWLVEQPPGVYDMLDVLDIK
ncbi:4-hydroxy-tetrahydrodipicolinate reductase [Pleionea sediminis]|uniref:4-hydroxy-tetrahydrodipicolinate reductase n=1 Tax=Pleionea sediminis TaxID=2569479 RepID=UPI001184C261|nr:4-hydroxy-tetrahydrodipicolinate reductase [Pleionea sediminis]